ncbi:GntR family transcriptional regulator [Saccharopolyspora sp. NPDC049426]|uniref:GntR family transcriptional regulator n=1 Tax=Saccharopolyspora sp. NPDC049426 TaxID=3155652 RepID=UPI0034410AFB
MPDVGEPQEAEEGHHRAHGSDDRDPPGRVRTFRSRPLAVIALRQRPAPPPSQNRWHTAVLGRRLEQLRDENRRFPQDQPLGGSHDAGPDRSGLSNLRADIESGELSVGSRLPSDPELGEIYGVARLTAIKAVNALRGEGLLKVLSGKGTFVSPKKS